MANQTDRNSAAIILELKPGSYLGSVYQNNDGPLGLGLQLLKEFPTFENTLLLVGSGDTRRIENIENCSKEGFLTYKAKIIQFNYIEDVEYIAEFRGCRHFYMFQENEWRYWEYIEDNPGYARHKSLSQLIVNHEEVTINDLIKSNTPVNSTNRLCVLCGNNETVLLDSKGKATPWCSLQCAGREMLHLYTHMQNRFGEF